MTDRCARKPWPHSLDKPSVGPGSQVKSTEEVDTIFSDYSEGVSKPGACHGWVGDIAGSSPKVL